MKKGPPDLFITCLLSQIRFLFCGHLDQKFLFWIYLLADLGIRKK